MTKLDLPGITLSDESPASLQLITTLAHASPANIALVLSNETIHAMPSVARGN